MQHASVFSIQTIYRKKKKMGVILISWYFEKFFNIIFSMFDQIKKKLINISGVENVFAGNMESEWMVHAGSYCPKEPQRYYVKQNDCVVII
jgi:hypothetical protein